jgi:hypothetical protein
MQTIKDKHTFIAAYGTVFVTVLGNLERRDFELVDLDNVPLPGDVAADFTKRGLGYVGTLGFVLGQFRSAFAVPLEHDVVDVLAKSYLEFIVAKFANAPLASNRSNGDGADWLKRLWTLPDTREN